MSGARSAIRAALRARMDALLVDADPPGPFVQVKNWTGELTRSRDSNPGMDALGDTPAVLIADARQTPQTTTRMTSGEVAQVLANQWVLFVVVENGQDPDASVALIDDCLDAVEASILGTQVEDGDFPITLESTTPWWAAPGSYCYAVTVRVERLVARTPAPEDGAVPLEQVTADVSLAGADPDLDEAAAPIAFVNADDLHD